MSDNPFGAYLSQPAETPAPAARPRGKRSRRRRREAEPQTIGKNPENLPVGDDEPEIERYDDDDYVSPAYGPPPTPTVEGTDDGFTGEWNDWTTEQVDDEPAGSRRGEDVDWNDWATATATEQSGDNTAPAYVPRLKDFGGGGPIARNPRKNYNSERFDEGRGRGRALAAIGGVAAAAAVIVVIGVIAAVTGDGQAATTTVQAGLGEPSSSPPTTMVVPPLPAWGLTGCEDFRSDSITISAEPGDTSTPQEAILGFEHSYFVARDAAKVRSFVVEDAHVGDAAALAEGIGRLPLGVRYCVHITRGDATDRTLWDVNLQQQWPGDEIPEKIAFRFQTREVAEGRHLIASITYR